MTSICTVERISSTSVAHCSVSISCTVFNVLITVLPLLIQVPPLPTVLQVATQASILALVYGTQAADIDCVTGLMEIVHARPMDGPPRPEQGGQRITPEWLNSLSNRDCLWRFRYIIISYHEVFQITHKLPMLAMVMAG